MNKPYDVPMIRDFLEQLLWELRIKHFETSSPGRPVNPELAEKAGYLIRRRRTAGLVSHFAIVADPSGDVALEQAAEVFSKGLAERSQQAIDALESLKEVFSEAFFCAAKPARIVQINIPAKNALTFWTSKRAEPDDGGAA